MFNDWEERIKDNPQVSSYLFWDIDKSKIDWNSMKEFVVERVIERGSENDFYAIFQLYGGPKGVREIIKKIEFCDPKDESLARILFNLKKNDLECYKRKRLRELHLNS